MSTEVTALQQQVSTMVTETNALTIGDAATYERAGEMVKAITGYIKRVGEVLDPIVAAAHETHKVSVAQRDALLKPALGAKRVLGERMAAWHSEQARLRREADEAAERERRRLEQEARESAAAEQQRLLTDAETRRLEEAVALEAQGDMVGAKKLLEEPVPVPVVTPAPVFVPRPLVAPAPAVEGIGFRDVWRAEVLSLPQLVQAVAAGEASITVLRADEVVLNQMARALKGALNLPGVRAVSSRTASVRT